MQSRRIRLAGHVTHMGDSRGTYWILGKRPLRRPGHKWKNNIKMDLQDVGWYELIWLRIRTGGRLF